MKLPIYQIDAFADQPFTGNPAAVCPLKQWLPTAVMQSIAAENRLSETAFFVASHQGVSIRWFTPVAEVNLCGHATLAAAFVLFHCLNYDQETIVFESKSGILNVSRKDDLFEMDFPAQPPLPCPTPVAIEKAFGVHLVECLKSEDYIVVFGSDSEVLAARPSLTALKALDLRGVIITSQSDDYDFVSRFFAPNIGIDEDPVTGSAHTQLAPYWSEKLGRSQLRAKQLSARGGELFCEVVGNRVMISGKAVKYMEGEIGLPPTNR